jgi:membrane-bound serine protease (ClpP class)
MTRRAALLGLLLLLFGRLPVRAQRPVVVLLRFEDTIQPISADYFDRALDHASAIGASALLVELDTPGGLLSSTRRMAGRIGASPVPVVVYVAPQGARAGSAGLFLLEAADVAAMAPGTNAGASHPIVQGGKLDEVMRLKLENDAAALLRSYTTARGRNPQVAEQAVRESKSWTEEEARQLGLIDLVAPDRRALLNAIDGRSIRRMNGARVVLHTRDAVLDEMRPSLRERVLDSLMNPDLAILMLIFGSLLIYVEFNAPGTIVPGALGTLLLLLSLFALNLLPIHFTALVLLAAAAILMGLEVKFTSHGVLGFVGILCLIFGMLTLVDGPVPEMRVHASVAIAAGLGFGLITVFLLRLAVRARRNKSLVGAEALLGQTAVVIKPLNPDGQVLVQGEIWAAHSPLPLPLDAEVRVRALDGLTLMVEPIPGDPSVQHPPY